MAKEKMKMLDGAFYKDAKRKLERVIRGVNESGKLQFLETLGFITAEDPGKAYKDFLKFGVLDIPALREIYTNEISHSISAGREFDNVVEDFKFVTYPVLFDHMHTLPVYHYPSHFLDEGVREETKEGLVDCVILVRRDIGRGRSIWEMQYNDERLRELFTHTLSDKAVERMKNLQKVADELNKTFKVATPFSLFKYFYTSQSGTLKIKPLRPSTWEEGEGLK